MHQYLPKAKNGRVLERCGYHVNATRSFSQFSAKQQLFPLHYYFVYLIVVGWAFIVFVWLQIVAGRFVNVFSTNDWILGVTFRARFPYSFPPRLLLTILNLLLFQLCFQLCSLLSHGLAGIQTVNYPGIENVSTSLVFLMQSTLYCVQYLLNKSHGCHVTARLMLLILLMATLLTYGLCRRSCNN